MRAWVGIVAGFLVFVAIGLLMFKVTQKPAQTAYQACVERGSQQTRAAHGLGSLSHLKTATMSEADVVEAVCASAPEQAFTPGFDFGRHQRQQGQKLAYTPRDHRTEFEKVVDCRDRGQAAVSAGGHNPKSEDSVEMVNTICDKNTENFR